MIEIITYHDTINYGALIQSLALKDFIQDKFRVKVKLCDYHPKKLTYSEKYRPLITKHPSKLFGTLKKNFEINLWKKKAFFNEELDTQNSDYFLNIYGSDEIWNINNAYHKYDPFYFGKNHRKLKISYAASIGRTDFKKIENQIKKELIFLLQQFDKISVRDLNTANFIYDLLKINPELVLDPTLIYTPKILDNKKFITKSLNFKYALVYGTVFSNDQKDKIFKFCQKRNLKIISVGYFNRWIKNNYLGLNPTTFYNFIKNSEVVFTSMFHGIMFSTKLNKQFYFTVDPIRSNKIRCFVDDMKLHEREIKEEIVNEYIDYGEINQTLNRRIKTSRNFLIQNIKRNLNIVN